MKALGSASAGRKALVANLRRITTVEGAGASILSTMSKSLERGLNTPSGGKAIIWRLFATSSAVSGSPLWNLTPCRILNVWVLPSSAGFGISVQRSHTQSVVEDGLY